MSDPKVSETKKEEMVDFEKNLDLLAAIIKRSRNKKLRAAFVVFLKSFNESLKNYHLFLQSVVTVKEFAEKWDVELVQDKSTRPNC
jgi:hypothetical protein